ncbi:DgyrCDS6675 [Dimorphilus gyrociliatus]|uniref:DgyrCDS6675 n=1 Tax=Dimorphilus gyrociliatus TaxID=2664684 RepID=A0A7I8VNR3_9ANNE|nr:DgyrCDS6675 [Dimorphilus gyrociliatus]
MPNKIVKATEIEDDLEEMQQNQVQDSNETFIKNFEDLKNMFPHIDEFVPIMNDDYDDRQRQYFYKLRWVLFRNSPKEMYLAIQGDLSNCWFIASLSSIAAKGTWLLLKNTIMTQTLQRTGLYKFKLFIQGLWKIVSVDNKLYVNKRGMIVFSKCQHCQLYVSFLEKALAKCFDSYAHLATGRAEEAFFILLGRPSKSYTGLPIQELWQLLKDNIEISAIVGSTKNEVTSSHYEGGHVYSVTSIVPEELSGEKKIRLRNPHGKKTVDDIFDEHGEIEVTLDEFHINMESVTICNLNYQFKDERYDYNVGKDVHEFNLQEKLDLTITLFHQHHRGKELSDMWIIVKKNLGENNCSNKIYSSDLVKDTFVSLNLQLTSGRYHVFCLGVNKEFKGVLQYSYLSGDGTKKISPSIGTADLISHKDVYTAIEKKNWPNQSSHVLRLESHFSQTVILTNKNIIDAIVDERRYRLENNFEWKPVKNTTDAIGNDTPGSSVNYNSVT